MEILAKPHTLLYHAPLMKTWYCIMALLVALTSGAGAGRVPPAPELGSPPRVESEIGPFQRDAIRRLVGAAPAAVESLTVGVIRVSFPGLDFGTGIDGVDHDSLYFENELRHVREYFAGASIGRFTLHTELQPDVFRLSRPESYYGEDDSWDVRISEMLMEVVGGLDSLVDFSRFDAIALIHAGSGQETDFNGDSPGQIWSGFIDPEEMAEVLADTLGTPGVPTADSLMGEPFFVDNIIVWPEEASQDGQIFGSLGIYVYQIGLRIGMLPLFDTTPSGFPDSQGIGQFGLMAYGLYNAVGFVPAFPCAFQRYLMGWVEPAVVGGEAGVRLKDINLARGSDTTLVRVPITPSEYYLVTNRVHDTDFDGRFDFVDVDLDGIPGNRDTLLGAEFDYFLTSTTNPPGLTGSGVLIWHVDESVILTAIEEGHYPNDDSSHKGVDLEEADGIQDLDRPGGIYSFGSYDDAFREGGNTSFGPWTNPSTRDNGGIPTGILIDGISGPGTFMEFAVRFEPPIEYTRTDFEGVIGDLSPIPSDLDLDGVVDLVIAADTGLVMAALGAGANDWDAAIDTLLYVPDALWTGPPILCDAGGDGEPEIFITARDGRFFAFHRDGSPYPIGDSTSPGSLVLDGSFATAPMAMELDGDPFEEVILLSSDGEEITLYMAGYSAPLQDSRWETAGTGIVKIAFAGGGVASHMSACSSVLEDGSWAGDGFFFASRSDTGELFVNFVPLVDQAYAMGIIEPVTRTIGRFPGAPASLSQPASGDVNGDGSGEGVFAIPGAGLVYYEPNSNGFVRRDLDGSMPSAPVLSDIDGDGVLETLLRDESRLYLLTGFGSPVVEWPRDIPAGALGVEERGRPASPLICDVDGDGDSDLLFTIAGDLYAYSSGGVLLEGWPLAGEGTGRSTPACVGRDPRGLYIFMCGSHSVLDDGGSAYISALRRYGLEDGTVPEDAWPFYRRDERGTAFQAGIPATVVYTGDLDEQSFICYPNPVRGGSFTARITLYRPARVRVTVFDLEGEKVYDAVRDHSWPGGSGVPFEESIPTGSMAGGIYLCRLEVEGDGWHWSGIKKVAITK